MNYVKRCTGSLCPLDSSLVRFTLNKFRAGHIVIPCACIAFGEILLCEHIHKLVVLGMYFDKSADILCLLEHLEENSVGNSEIIDHKHLKRRNADLHAFSDTVEKPVVHILYSNMERVIDRRVRSAKSIASFNGICHLLVEIL